jgi:pimeloyl-ACP methyl ester carboxylesterase
MPSAHVNGIDIAYDTSGDPSHPALLLVMGLGGQLTAWPDGFVDLLVARGFFVIRYDNRDTGLSTQFEGMPDFTTAFTGDGTTVPYRIEDMADDGVELLTALGIERAHVVGASMGGMITQAMVIHHPERFLTACSIMSTTGDRVNGMPTGEAMSALLRPPARSRDEAIAASVEGSKVIGSPAYPTPEDEVRQRAGAAYDRAFTPEGTARQLAAILVSPDRTEGLHGVDLPFLVIHGAADPLVQPSGGDATAAAVPGAKLIAIAGMGHDLPDALWPEVVEAIVANTQLADVEPTI